MTIELAMPRHIILVGAVLVLGACQSASPRTSSSDRPQIRPATERVEATDEAVEQAFVDLARSSQAVANEWRGRSFEEFEATVYREPEGGKYIVSGDLAISDRKHLEEFFEHEVLRASNDRGLIVHSPGGVDATWDDAGKRSLSYCVSRSFGARYDTVVTAMTNATGAWQAVADVRFMHDAAQDDDCTAVNAQVVFDVRPVSGADYLARAFFPDDVRANRNVLIDDSSFGLDPGENLSLVGILRHELGHTLGFRHEHTRPESGTCFEDNDWRPLTDYDAFSVMHYPQCNGGGDWSLTLTVFDQNGVACLYGPAPGFNIDTSVCQPPTPPPPAVGCGPETVTVNGSVATGQENAHGPFAAAPGSRFVAAMGGTGDPDLYVRFGAPPARTQYDCRPYLTGAIERCEITVPPGASQAFVMIRGYQTGTYQLEIEHTPPQ